MTGGRRVFWEVTSMFLVSSRDTGIVTCTFVKRSELGSVMMAAYELLRASGGIDVWIVLLRLTGVWFGLV